MNGDNEAELNDLGGDERAGTDHAGDEATVDARALDDHALEELKISRLADGLDRYVRNLGAPPISILTQLEDRWPEIVGPGMATSTRPVELVNGVLTIACTDTASASQIGWMETQIVQRFTTTFNTTIVQRVIGRVSG